MKYLLFLTAFAIVSCGSIKAQSRYPDKNYDSNLTSLGNLWVYVEKLDRTIDSLSHELSNQKKIMQFNVDIDKYIFRKYDSAILHGIGVYPSYKSKDTLKMGPFYIY